MSHVIVDGRTDILTVAATSEEVQFGLTEKLGGKLAVVFRLLPDQAEGLLAALDHELDMSKRRQTDSSVAKRVVDDARKNGGGR